MDIEEIKSFFSGKDNYISFRSSENVTLINKNNSFSTPTGVYTYPCSYYRDKVSGVSNIDELKSVFPFLGRYDPKFIYFYTLNPRFNHLTSESTFSDILPYYKKIINYKVPRYHEGIIENLKKYINNEKEPEDDFYNLKSFKVFSSHDIRDNKSEHEIVKFWDLLYYLQDDDPNKWSNILRNIGIGYLVDYGIGYIHSNEPVQSVIINTKAIESIKIFDIFDSSTVKNRIKSGVREMDFDSVINDMNDIYVVDKSFFWSYLTMIVKFDKMQIFNFSGIIVNDIGDRNAISILGNIIGDIDSEFCLRLGMEENLLKVFVNKFGDTFIKKYITELSKSDIGKYGGVLMDEEDKEVSTKNKVIIASLLNANRAKVIDFFNRHDEYEYDNELEFFDKNEDKIRKFRNRNSLSGLGDYGFRFSFDDDKEDKEILRKYELFKQSYEKATQNSWTYEKFKQRSQYWDFYGDYNGYVSVRMQKNGLYKFTSVAGSLKSISKGLEEISKKNLPVWGAVSPKIGEVMVKRYGYYKPNNFLMKMLYKIFKKSSGDVKTELNSDGTITVHYEDVGVVDKVIITNQNALGTIKNLIKNRK